MINKTSHIKISWIIAAVAAFLFVPFLGGVHLFDWDEINFAEAAREMIVTGDYLTVQINFQPFWEKPPLFIWMQVLAMKMFGINEFAARFPNAICGIATLLVIFNIGRKIRDNQFGLLWVLAFAGSVLPFFYFKSGIIDPWFNLFIFLGIWFLVRYSNPADSAKLRNAAFAGAFAGLAILTKGPVGFLLIALTGGIFLLFIKFRLKVKFVDVLVYFLMLALVGGSWFVVMILNGQLETVIDFIVYQVRLFQTKDAGHGGFFGYHFVVLFFTVFPTSILALKAFRNETIDNDLHRLTKKWMLILFWVVLILFSIVKTKIVHYSSLAYFPLTFLAAGFVYNAWQNKHEWSRWVSVTVIAVAVLFTIPVTVLPFVDTIKQQVIDMNVIHDDFAVANLQADGGWRGFEFLPGILFLSAIIFVFIKVPKTDVLKRAVSLWVITLLFTTSVIMLVVPRIERYSQNALVEFYKSHAGEDVYLKNIHFKSYAGWFYGATTPPKNQNYYDGNWLLTGDIDKDVYFVTKIQFTERMLQYPDIQKIGEKNGFVFYQRKSGQ
ncbi:MAG TPA: glycosyl transferase [Prolixibacteraceae bacterium]|nr:glycosyl transferase [Prolixibacteraceae bacterium]